jgi:minor histocompatibility antigen H13
MAGFVLLGGLFFYDIFFVFGTDVMVTVAVSMDVPIKVLPPPKPISPSDVRV